MIRIGFHSVAACDINAETFIAVRGKLTFRGSAHIGRGSKIKVAKNGICDIGDNFAISASSSIVCNKLITLGRDIQFAWDCLVMDSDAHKIFDKNKRQLNADRPVVIGDKVWVAARSMILKGANIPNNCVVGAGSTVTNGEFQPNTVIIGNPAKSMKEIDSWEL